ncbi:hypothetical protein K474DRAFT_1657299 [Panus rudis PR-1116 ss-1]|nr:hypothetical protein K474DRAFT_1657299 [Panus rudis PR-1116 ss-1]
MSFAEIPTELLVLVFAHLSGRDLLKCQAVSRKWRDVIMHAMELQYIIDLVKYGYKSSVPLQDTLSFTPQIPIQDLHHLEEAWFRICDSPQERPRPPRINIPVSSQEWYGHYDFRLFGHNLFVWNQDSDGVLDILQFEDQKNHVSFRRVDYDRVRILQVVAYPKLVNESSVYNGNGTIIVHVLWVHWQNDSSASNTEPELQVLHEIPLPSPDRPLGYHYWTRVVVKISGEYILVQWRRERAGLGDSDNAPGEDPNIAVCLWRSGHVLQLYFSNAEICYMDAVLACNQYLLVLRHSRSETNLSTHGVQSVLYIDVYILPTDKFGNSRSPLLLSIFEFPALRPEIAVNNPRLTSGKWKSPSLRSSKISITPPHSQITLSPLDTMLHFDIWCGITEYELHYVNERFSLFVPLSTFIRNMPLPLTSETPLQPMIHRWSSWGPDGTRLHRTDSLYIYANGDVSINFVPVYISGFRAILQNEVGFMDFNPHYVSKFSSGETLRTPGATVVKSPTYVDCQTFADPVTSALPYVWIPLPADVISARSLDHQASFLPKFFFQDYDGLKMMRLRANPANPTNVGSLQIHAL